MTTTRDLGSGKVTVLLDNVSLDRLISRDKHAADIEQLLELADSGVVEVYTTYQFMSELRDDLQRARGEHDGNKEADRIRDVLEFKALNDEQTFERSSLSLEMPKDIASVLVTAKSIENLSAVVSVNPGLYEGYSLYEYCGVSIVSVSNFLLQVQESQRHAQIRHLNRMLQQSNTTEQSSGYIDQYPFPGTSIELNTWWQSDTTGQSFGYIDQYPFPGTSTGLNFNGFIIEFSFDTPQGVPITIACAIILIVCKVIAIVLRQNAARLIIRI
jgi:hypothetical protein